MTMPFGYIYVLLLPNGKRYIGQTIRTIEERVYEHVSDAKKGCSFPLHRAMRKYGEGNIRIESILPLRCTREYLDFIEDRVIMALNTLIPNGYNLKRGGGHASLSEESIAKRTATRKSSGKTSLLKGRILSAEHKAKIAKNNSRFWKGKSKSAEHKAKIAAARMGSHASNETRMKMSIARKGRKHSEESKAKISAKKRGTPSPMKGKQHSKETRAKMSASRHRLLQVRKGTL